jgi:hypothetical protein
MENILPQCNYSQSLPGNASILLEILKNILRKILNFDYDYTFARISYDYLNFLYKNS